MFTTAEYIWLDGTKPTQQLRSKTRIIPDNTDQPTLDMFPEWSFDGSSTGQATGNNSDCILKPVCFVRDPIRSDGYLVLNEVFTDDGNPHSTNTRAILREILAQGGEVHDPWIGFEQEYTMFRSRTPLGWPEQGYPAPQGPYYCGVGAELVFGRELAEEHMQACLEAGIMFYGINVEVMPGQWEFQVGYRGVANESADVLTVADHRNIALWLLARLGEDFGVTINIDNKPILGDWNGAGCHTNFSTKNMRNPEQGRTTIDAAIEALRTKHQQHITLYGHKLEERLTGSHETCSIEEFRAGVADRGASVRIPQQVYQEGCGYIEDRRPGANMDGYLVAARLIATICEIDDTLIVQHTSRN
ncbi:MAG: glutamine synthetase [Legionellales bacterium]|nr:glutamine synthetase [Legionellales bacterium]